MIPDFDKQASQTVNNLISEFDHTLEERPSIVSKYSVGVEIEVKFRYFFPELFRDFFENKSYSLYPPETKEKIDMLISEQEKELLPKLERTVALGIPRGLDKYWEFAFNPVYNLTLLYYQIEILKKVNLIPAGRHSFHISVGGIQQSSDLFYFLMILELLFIDKERIKSGFSKKDGHYSDTWAKKGMGGIFKKGKYDLLGSDRGVEFRTLYIDEHTDIYRMFQILSSFLNGTYKKEALANIKQEMLKVGLPDKNWEKPHLKPEIWEKYIAHFDYLSNFANEQNIQGN